MREHRAQLVLVVRAFEEVDRNGQVLPLKSRAAATHRTIVVTGGADLGSAGHRRIKSGESVFRRARILFEQLGRSSPSLLAILRSARLGSGFAPIVIGIAPVVGALATALEPGLRIGIVQWPLLAILAWNVISYVRMLALPQPSRDQLGSGAAERPPVYARDGLTVPLANLYLKFTLWRSLRTWGQVKEADLERKRIITDALVRFAALWHRLTVPLFVYRVRRMLHVAALMLAGAALSVLAIRGAGLDRPAAWVEGWLPAEAARSLVSVVLAPAAALLDVPLPTDGPAGPWLGLYAVTLLLFVGLPRVLLIALESWRCARLAADLPVDLDASYYRKLFDVETADG